MWFLFICFNHDEAVRVVSCCYSASNLILAPIPQTPFRLLIAPLFVKIPSLLGDKQGNPEVKAEEE